MGDIYVHVRMKECCRNVLKDLDKRKARAKIRTGLLGTPSLHKALGEKTIDDAKAAIAGDGSGSAAGAPSELERLTRAACEKVCTRHAGEHDGKGETEEGAFWWMIAAAVAGRPVSQAVAAGGAKGLAGKGAAKAWDGQAVAAKAKEKAKEYKDKSVTYSMKAPFYPASTHSDCSHFVNDVLKSSGYDVPYVTTATIGDSKDFLPVNGAPQPGDIIWQPGSSGNPGHMGVYTANDGAGHPLGVQMGNHGAKEVPWGPGGELHGGGSTKYYRPVGR